MEEIEADRRYSAAFLDKLRQGSGLDVMRKGKDCHKNTRVASRQELWRGSYCRILTGLASRCLRADYVSKDWKCDLVEVNYFLKPWHPTL